MGTVVMCGWKDQPGRQAADAAALARGRREPGRPVPRRGPGSDPGDAGRGAGDQPPTARSRLRGPGPVSARQDGVRSPFSYRELGRQGCEPPVAQAREA